MLEGWIESCPGATLRLRSYNEVVASGGSVQDFMTVAGLPLPSDHRQTQRVNQSLHRGLIEIARQANANLDASTARDVFKTLLRLGTELDLPPTADVELYGVLARSEMTKNFAPIHEWLSTLVGQPFFPDLTDLLQLRPDLEHEVNQAAVAQLRARYRLKFPRAALNFIDTFEPIRNFT